MNHAFFSGIGIHELTTEVQHNRHDGGRVYDQNVGSVSLTSALSGGYAFAVGIHIAEKIDRVNLMREQIWIGAGFEFLEHPASIMIGTQRNRGGSFLGKDLDKRIWSVGLTIGEIQALMVQDKWLADITAAIGAKVEPRTESLTARVRVLTERYRRTLPQIVDDLAGLEARVAGHLAAMRGGEMSGDAIPLGGTENRSRLSRRSQPACSAPLV